MMPRNVSAWVAANWFCVETLFGLMTTYFLLFELRQDVAFDGD